MKTKKRKWLHYHPFKDGHVKMDLGDYLFVYGYLFGLNSLSILAGIILIIFM
jgi:hypothetical protein